MIGRDRVFVLRMLQVMLPLALLVASCAESDGSEDKVVARAYEEKLLWSDLRSVIPFNINAEDSAALARQFIHNWLKRRTVLHQAEQNLPEEKKDFEAQLRDYRNSLVIYAYEEALVQQKLDTVVSHNQLEEYHRQNTANFRLREPIMRVRWARVRESDQRTLKKLEEQFLSNDPERTHELEMWLASRKIAIVDEVDRWITAAQLIGALALIAPDRFAVPNSAGKSFHRDGDAAILLEVLEWSGAGEPAPLQFVEADIRSIIINQRKLRFLEKMREDLYLEALEKQQIETY